MERPSLSLLGHRKLQCCQPVGVVLHEWEDRNDLEGAQLARIPESLNDSHTECAICFQELSDDAPQRFDDNDGGDTGDKSVAVIVDFEGSCGHSFHVKCLKGWLDARDDYDETLKCPYCTQPIMDSWVDRIYKRQLGMRIRATPPLRRHDAQGPFRPPEDPRLVPAPDREVHEVERILRAVGLGRRRQREAPTWREVLMDTLEELRRVHFVAEPWMTIIRALVNRALP